MLINMIQGTELPSIKDKQHLDDVKDLNKPCLTENIVNKQSIIDFEQLWYSSTKCQRGVRWKPSVKNFIINTPVEIHKMHEQLENNTWKNGKPKEILILYPKRREGLSIPFKDRVYQRSINDNALYPSMVKHFVFDNCACQKGKGTSFARRRMKEHLWNFYTHYGNDGYILQIDVKSYYQSMVHNEVKKVFRKHLNDDIYTMVCDVLDQQYVGEVGYNAGSQMVQIAGISFLDSVDHFCKEQLHAKYYIRYMDDISIISNDTEYLKHCLEEIEKKLNEIKLTTHPKKTTVKSLFKGFMFLGFQYKLTDTGKIIMLIDTENVKHERKKLARLVAKAKRGETTKEKVDECFNSWKAHAEQGNSYNLIKTMNQYYKDLWEKNYDNSN